MKAIFEISCFIVLAGVPLQLYYWCVLRPVFLTKIGYDISRLRSKLHEVASTTTKEGKIAVPIIDRNCEFFLQVMSRIDLLRPALARVPVDIKLRVDRDREIVEGAPPEIREINKELEVLVVVSATFNSPGIVVLCAILLPLVSLIVLGCLATIGIKNAVVGIGRRLRVGLYLQDQQGAFC
jgi:hypothetical protein